jgi:hypothetical protein
MMFFLYISRMTYLNLSVLWFFPYNWVDLHISWVIKLDKKWAEANPDEVIGSLGGAVEG